MVKILEEVVGIVYEKEKLGHELLND